MTTKTSSFTCLTCHSLFSCLEDQKEHYRTEWHRHNLSRKVQDLPPLSEKACLEKLAKLESEAVAAQPKKTTRVSCEECKKSFASEKALQAHNRSAKHAVSEEENEVVEMPSQPDLCFICTRDGFKTEETIYLHLRDDHNLFVPDLDHLVDPSGLLAYLQYKVNVAHRCLYCHDHELGLKGVFADATSAKRHMQDTGHAKLRFDDLGQDELSQFYDFGDSDWEDEEATPDAYVTADESELVLASGARLGSRSNQLYYKQNLLPYDGTGQVFAKPTSALVAQVIANRTQTGNGQLVPGFRDYNKTVVLDFRQKRSQRKNVNLLQEKLLGVGVRTNRLQKHFREQIL